MVIVTYQMKNPMNNHTVELVFKLSPIFDGIFLYTVDTDKKTFTLSTLIKRSPESIFPEQ